MSSECYIWNIRILHIFVLDDDIEVEEYPIAVYSPISVLYICWNMQWGRRVKKIVPCNHTVWNCTKPLPTHEIWVSWAENVYHRGKDLAWNAVGAVVSGEGGRSFMWVIAGSKRDGVYWHLIYDCISRCVLYDIVCTWWHKFNILVADSVVELVATSLRTVLLCWLPNWFCSGLRCASVCARDRCLT